MQSRTFSRVLVVAFLAVGLMSGTFVSAYGKMVSECECTANVMRTVTYCIAGTNYTVNVYFCEANSNPASINGVCNTERKLDRLSVISKICFPNGRPPGVTDKQII